MERMAITLQDYDGMQIGQLPVTGAVRDAAKLLAAHYVATRAARAIIPVIVDDGERQWDISLCITTVR